MHASGVPTYPASTLLERSLDLLFPPLCVSCRRMGRWICPDCWTDVSWLPSRPCFECGQASPTVTCVRCSRTAPTLDRFVAVASYQGTAREAVHALKFHGRHAIAGLLGRLMAAAANDITCDYVVSVPLHPSRRRERGYDQSALLAQVVARTIDRPFDGGALCRTRRTAQQALLAAPERRANVTGAFAGKRQWNGQIVLLVDDVSTTGATLDVVASTLLAAGAGKIIGLVFAH